MSREDFVNERLTGTPFYVKTYSPGDGTTRYKFFSCRDKEGRRFDYFAGSGIVRVLGAGTAAAVAQALAWGYSKGFKDGYKDATIDGMFEETHSDIGRDES